MARSPSYYDVFISYAREDGAWVREHLYEPLMRCQTVEGRRPSIYLDTSKDTIRPGSSWISSVANAIQNSRKLVPVYSPIYFAKDVTQWELRKCWQIDLYGKDGKINALLIDPQAEAQIPFEVNDLQYVATDIPDWFDRLIGSLGLQPAPTGRKTLLAFRDQPANLPVNHTLAPVTVAVVDEAGAVAGDTEISISCKQGTLQGTVIESTRDGVARFEDLSFGSAVNKVRLIATADGHEAARSQRFSVLAPDLPEDSKTTSHGSEARPDEPLIDASGEAVFFASGNALAIVEPERIGVHALNGEKLCEAGWEGRLRSVARGGSLLAFTSWSGDVHLFGENGEHCFARLGGESRHGLHIPGGLTTLADAILVGFWNGDIYHLSLTDPASRVARYDPGVQALAGQGDLIFVTGLDGTLSVFKDGSVVNTISLGGPVSWLRAYPHCVIAVGEYELFQFDFSRGTVLSEELRLARITQVLVDVDRPVVIDAEGKGIRFNAGLDRLATFSTVAGTRPIAADHEGRFCAFAHPDGSRSLMVGGRIVYSQSDGTLALSPDGRHFACGREDRIHLMTEPAILRLAEQRFDAATHRD